MEKFFRDETGSLTLEWIFMFSLLVVGIAGGVAIIRNAMILEAGEDAGAAVSLTPNYTVNAPPTLSLDDEPCATIKGFQNVATPNKVQFGNMADIGD